MKKNSFHKDDRGASLLAVLILMVVVSAIAVVITKITIVNIQMKEVERGTKKNFYSADAIMDDLCAPVQGSRQRRHWKMRMRMCCSIMWTIRAAVRMRRMYLNRNI